MLWLVVCVPSTELSCRVALVDLLASDENEVKIAEAGALELLLAMVVSRPSTAWPASTPRLRVLTAACDLSVVQLFWSGCRISVAANIVA